MAVKEKASFAFPEMFNIDTGKTMLVTGLKSTNTNIGLLLRTSVFEMFGDPAMGSKLVEFLFAPDIDLIRDVIVDHLQSVLEKQQPNIEVTYINLEYEEGKEETVHIKVDYYDKEVGQYYNSISSISLSELKTEGGLV